MIRPEQRFIMIPKHPNEWENVILRVVRGERSWHSLRTIGIKIERLKDGWNMQNCEMLAVKPSDSDFAIGFLKYKDRPEALKEWASLILASVGFLDIDSLSDSSYGEILLDALWDASTGEGLDAGAVRVAEKLRNERTGQP